METLGVSGALGGVVMNAGALGVSLIWLVLWRIPFRVSGGALLGAALVGGYVLPILALTLWSVQRLSPATLTFLLTAEILSGILPRKTPRERCDI